jgi:hypothetical protein
LFFGWLLIPRELLILHYAREAKGARNAGRGRSLGTRPSLQTDEARAGCVSSQGGGIGIDNLGGSARYCPLYSDANRLA